VTAWSTPVAPTERVAASPVPVRQSGTFVSFAPEIPTMAHSEDNPLDEVRSAHEEEYFHKKNQELIARLRDKFDKETAAQALADKLKWPGQFVTGFDHRQDGVHVFLPRV
jgi:hypothetical protein